MRFLKSLYRNSFCSRGKKLLSELFDELPLATHGVVLEEMGRPGGAITLHRWWKTDRQAGYQRTHKEKANEQINTTEATELEIDQFNELLVLIETADTPKLDHCYGTVRDGVLYSVALGDRRHIRSLSMDNPRRGTRHHKLVRALKHYAGA